MWGMMSEAGFVKTRLLRRSVAWKHAGEDLSSDELFESRKGWADILRRHLNNMVFHEPICHYAYETQRCS